MDPVRKSASPTNSEGTRARFARSYSAGARKAHVCQRMIGEASTSTTRNPSLKTIITGSVGLVTTSLTPGRHGAMGRLSRLTSWNCCTTQSPMAKPTTTAPSDRRIRCRSSSRWSRNGISPGGPVMGRGRRPGSVPERLQPGAGQGGFVGLGILLHDPLVRLARLGVVLPPLRQEPEVVECRAGPRRLGILLHHLAVIGLGRIGVLRGIALPDEIQRVGGPLAGRVLAQQLAQA